MKNSGGFSLVELIMTVIIIGILSIVTVVTYRGYMQRSIESEAEMMLGKLNEAQRVYYIRNKKYLGGLSNQSHNNLLGVDFRKNKYFTSFTITTTS